MTPEPSGRLGDEVSQQLHQLLGIAGIEAEHLSRVLESMERIQGKTPMIHAGNRQITI